jgi:hypothetical protein
MEPENEQFEDLPQSLIAELKATEQVVPLITARVDREVAGLAADHFASRRKRAWAHPAWAAIAATILVAILATQFVGVDTAPPEAVYADVDGSGQIDIADVLALARTRNPEQITQAELDAFAMRVVSLSSGGDAS